MSVQVHLRTEAVFHPCHFRAVKRPAPPLAVVPALSQDTNNNLKVMDEMTPCQSVEEALHAIRRFSGPPDEFKLALAETLLDPMGVNMAIVTDDILERGWMPDGFEDKGDHRLFRYKSTA